METRATILMMKGLSIKKNKLLKIITDNTTKKPCIGSIGADTGKSDKSDPETLDNPLTSN